MGTPRGPGWGHNRDRDGGVQRWGHHGDQDGDTTGTGMEVCRDGDPTGTGMGTQQGPGWRCAGMGTPRGPGCRCCRDGDTMEMGTSRMEAQEPRRAPGSPGRGGQGHQGVREAPAPPAELSPLGIPQLGTPARLHPAAPGQVPPPLCTPQVMGATARLPPARRTPGRGGEGCSPQPRAPAPIPARGPGSSTGHRAAHTGAAFWVDFAAFGARRRQWRPGSPREGGARATGANRF